jgi:L-ornithine Nalpha-acyltransferase
MRFELPVHAGLRGRLVPRFPKGRRQVPRWPEGKRAAARIRMNSSELRASTSYGRIGGLEVRLASSAREIALAQRLRYRVFYEEMSADADPITRARRRDVDAYDGVCDHLLVLDHEAVGPAKTARDTYRFPRQTLVVGTYRVLRQSVAIARGGFYTQGEYDIAPLLARHPDLAFMELGRSCVLEPYRNKRTLELLWHGLWTYVREHKVDVMIGCASFEGTDPTEHRIALSFLHHYAAAPPEWEVRAHPRLAVAMDMLPKDQVDARAALRLLPPLIKGYLRLGASVGQGAVIDRQFRTTDVCIILPVARIDPRYFAHFGSPDERGSRVAAN